MKGLGILLFLVTYRVQGRPTKSHNHFHNKNHKKYVIEVQDHQQAMKYADPLSDLEETVRRGFNDPYNDRNFFMNNVNEEFFQNGGSSNIHKTPERAFNPNTLSRQQIQSTSHVFNLTPQRIINENSFKSNNIIQRPRPMVARQENARKNTGIPRAQNTILSLLNEYKLHNLQSRPVKTFIRQPQPNVGHVNPLTGLPENLEDKAYGAVTSIESVGDDVPKQPSSVVIDLNAARRRQSINNKQKLSPRHFGAKPSPKTNNLSLMAGTLGSNFDQIQSFLQADDILRKKFDNSNLGPL
eukprot:TCONS_00050228-protein